MNLHVDDRYCSSSRPISSSSSAGPPDVMLGGRKVLLLSLLLFYLTDVALQTAQRSPITCIHVPEVGC